MSGTYNPPDEATPITPSRAPCFVLSPVCEAAIGLRFVLGELVRTTAGKWITRPPTRCPNGHTLGPNQVLVGHVAYLGHGGGHTNMDLPNL
jgi:hypothetical protein